MLDSAVDKIIEQGELQLVDYFRCSSAILAQDWQKVHSLLPGHLERWVSCGEHFHGIIMPGEVENQGSCLYLAFLFFY